MADSEQEHGVSALRRHRGLIASATTTAVLLVAAVALSIERSHIDELPARPYCADGLPVAVTEGPTDDLRAVGAVLEDLDGLEHLTYIDIDQRRAEAEADADDDRWEEVPEEVRELLGVYDPGPPAYRFSVDPDDEHLMASLQWRVGHAGDAFLIVGRDAARCDLG